ncbi:GNAT family N-acetyltransferase [Flagellimonas sp. 2504JD4-2]
MTNNPYNTNKFAEIWLRHFMDPSTKAQRFDYIEGVNFYKSKRFPLYINIGRNLTKGFYYTVDKDKVKSSHNIFLIRDIPTYYKVPEIKGVKRLKAVRARQYNGYLTYLDKYSNIDDFLSDKYNSSGRNVLRRRTKGLEGSFDIEHKAYYGDITKESYDLIIEKFHELLVKRFTDKQTDYHILDKWDYLKELIYHMVLNKEAVLLVTYESGNPIGMYLSICMDKVVSGAIPVFDTDYYKFGLGTLLTNKMIEWSIENQMEIFDSSKGDYGEKARISDLKYSFEYHILYNPRSIISSAMAFGLGSFFKLKQFLREKEVHSLYHNIKFKLSPGKAKKAAPARFQFENHESSTFDKNGNTIIDLMDARNSFLKKMVFDFLYKSRDHIKDVEVYKNEKTGSFFVVGKDKTLEIIPA